MRVLTAMSGGVDSSVAAALVVEAGHEVVGATMKLWGGPGDRGCCSVSDVDDARRVAQQLGIAHHVFNLTDDFERHVVEPYVSDHAAGRTPNPCIECNRHLKFDLFLDRAVRLGFDAVATGHHARVVGAPGDRWELRRGADPAKDQSYVLHMLGQHQLSRLLLPVGTMTKTEVRQEARRLGLRTATKPDSQDVCFISKAGGREEFLGARIPLRRGRVVDEDGIELGEVPAVELVTVGQRRGIGAAGGRYVIGVDTGTGTVRVAPLDALLVRQLDLERLAWVDGEPGRGEKLEVQMSAHGSPVAGRWAGSGRVELDAPARRVAPGQSVVLYRREAVVGGGVARHTPGVTSAG